MRKIVLRAEAYSLVLTVGLGAAFALPPRSAEEPEGLFQRIKARAAEHLAQLPNYTCHQTIDRVMRTRNGFQHLDTVELEVAFVGQQELFSRPGEDKFGERPIEKMVSGGTIGNGVLGSHIDLIFTQEGAEFKYAGAGKKNGRKTLRYDLRVPIEKSTFLVRHNGSAGVAGYEGSIWVDAETFDLVRVDFKVNRIPSHLGVRLIEKSLHYKKVTIANTEFNLPDHSELAATDDMGNYTLNIIKLNRCREFGANSVVKYGSPTEGTASREQPER
jgi:hypothetical protein